MWFGFKGPKYAKNIVFLSILVQIFGNIKKIEWLFFSHWIFVEGLGVSWSLPASEICL